MKLNLIEQASNLKKKNTETFVTEVQDISVLLFSSYCVRNKPEVGYGKYMFAQVENTLLSQPEEILTVSISW